jgi:hypothetical protein
MKTLADSKVVPKAASELCFGFASLLLVDFPQCPLLIGCRKKMPADLMSHLCKVFSTKRMDRIEGT